MKIHVNTRDLRQALTAVIPHASDIEASGLMVVHFTVTTENLYVQASNGSSAGLAIVSVWDHEDLTGDPNDDCFELTVHDAKEALRIFKAKNDPDGDLDDQIKIDVSEEDLAIVDVSGLFPGKQWSIPNTTSSEHFPNLPKIFSDAIDGRAPAPQRYCASGGLLRLFSAAASAYGHRLIIEPTPRPRLILISCGESFLGALIQSAKDHEPEQVAQADEWRESWTHRLPELATAIKSTRAETDQGGSHLQRVLKSWTVLTPGQLDPEGAVE